MPRNQRNSKKKPPKAIKKERPPIKKGINAANHVLRRSTRRKSNAFVSNNIASNRLTLPLTFLDRGIKSRTVTAAKEETVVLNGRNKHILNEDLLALIPSAEVGNSHSGNFDIGGSTTRRITRSLQNRFLNASSYYLNRINKEETYSNSQKIDSGQSNSDNQTETSANSKKSQENFEERRIEFKNPRINTPSLSASTYVQSNVSVTNTTITDDTRPVNYNFCRNIFNKVIIELRSAKKDCTCKLKESIQKVNDILEGKFSPPVSPVKNMSAKRLSDEDYDKGLSAPLVPQSQWVYSTPDKQNMKQFVFEDGSDKILPAVIRTSRKSKVLYDIKNEVVQNVNLNKFNSQNIPIDRRYLKTICENSIENDDIILPKPSKKQRLDSNDVGNKENLFSFVAPPKKNNEFVFKPQARCIATSSSSAKDEFNVFLSGDSEESIDIQKEIQRGTDNAMDVSFELNLVEDNIKKDPCDLEEKCGNFDFRQCRSALPKDLYYVEHDPYDTAPVDYRQQLLMATQRPAKNARRIQKRHLLKAKSLSFDNTPPGAKVAVFEPKRIDMLRNMEEECVDQFEKEFCILNAAKPSLEIPHTITSGALMEEPSTSTSNCSFDNNQFDIQSFNDNLQTMFKFYPRRNYDPE